VLPPILRRGPDLIVHSTSAECPLMETTMPRYIVDKDFPDGLQFPIDDTGARACLAVIDSNLADQVIWVHSYVSLDKKKTFCIYDGPSPEAIRRTAGRSKLPVGRITEVRVLDPYFYK